MTPAWTGRDNLEVGANALHALDVLRYEGKVSVVLPAYNEEGAIAAAISSVSDYLSGRSADFEIVVVDDGSTDATASTVEKLAASDSRLRLVAGRGHRSKGHAVRQGILATTGEVALFLDVDMSTPIEMMDRVWPQLEDGAHVVVGSRRIEGARIEVPQPPVRAWIGGVFRRSVCRLLGISVSDTQCGFKAFDGPVGRRLFRELELDDWTFDVELLVAASQAGLRVAEIPVVWRDSARTTVRPVRDAPTVAYGVARILGRKLRGRWRGLGLTEDSR